MYIADMLSRAYLQTDHSQHGNIRVSGLPAQPGAIVVPRDC